VHAGHWHAGRSVRLRPHRALRYVCSVRFVRCLLRLLHQAATLAAIRTRQPRTVTDVFFCCHLYKMLAGRLSWESDVSDDGVLLLHAVGNKRERKWVHEVNMKRGESGEFHHLMK